MYGICKWNWRWCMVGDGRVIGVVSDNGVGGDWFVR